MPAFNVALSSRPHILTPALNSKFGHHSQKSRDNIYHLASRNINFENAHDSIGNTDISDSEFVGRKKTGRNKHKSKKRGTSRSTGNRNRDVYPPNDLIAQNPHQPILSKNPDRNRKNRKPQPIRLFNLSQNSFRPNQDLNILVQSIPIKPRPPSGVISDFPCKTDNTKISRIMSGKVRHNSMADGRVSPAFVNVNQQSQIPAPEVSVSKSPNLNPNGPNQIKINPNTRSPLIPTLVSLDSTEITWAVRPKRMQPNINRHHHIQTFWKSPDLNNGLIPGVASLNFMEDGGTNLGRPQKIMKKPNKPVHHTQPNRVRHGERKAGSPTVVVEYF